MQNFEIFERVFTFFVKSKLNEGYVQNIDEQIHDNVASKQLKQLITDVHTFHTMRQELCGKIFEHLNNHSLLHELIHSTAIQQYNSVPQQSICIFSQQKLSQQQGITIIIGTKKMHIVTLHKRFKRLLYNFWYMVHFTDEIMKNVTYWLKQQRWWLRGKCQNITERIINHQDHMFAKKAYVKLKSINTYIQQEMASLPINHTHLK